MGAQGIAPPPVTTKHDASVTGEAQSGLVLPSPVEEENSPAEIPWYDKVENINENYRKFLSCVRIVNGRQTVVVPEGGMDEGPVRVGGKSDGGGKKDGEEGASRATSGKNRCDVGKKEKGKGKVAAITMGGPALKSPVGDSTVHPQKGHKEKNNGRKIGAKKMKVAEKEENPSAEPHVGTLNTASEGKGKAAAITTDGHCVRDSTTHHSVVKEEKKSLKELHVETLNTVKRKRKFSDVQNAKSCTALGKERVVAITGGEPTPKSRVRDSTMHPKKGQKEKNGRKDGAKKMKVVEEEGKPSKEVHVGTLSTVKRKKRSGDEQNVESHTASTGRKPQLRRSTRLMPSPPESDH
ncbi:hypothetical protein ZWY2020_055336 [Hordeum vulgare]|nr:hypothetical protein ZWY2020_055336 [Hordeum vulgare]